MKLFALATFCLLALTARAEDHPKEYYDPQVQRLIAATVFAFGPVNFDGSPSDTEKAFGAILRKTDGVRYMVAAFDAATPEGRCYALVALREYSTDLFGQCFETFRKDLPETITVANGSRTVEIPAKQLLADINRGLYRKYFLQYAD